MLIYELRNLLMLTIPILSFVALKLVMQYLIYEPLKYKDDGRDVVSVADFFTIHVTFPAINAWITYQMYYCVMVTVATLCDTKLFSLYDSSFCIEYQGAGYDKRLVYWYTQMVPLSVIVFALLFVEASVNLTYYRDCVFSSTVFCIYLGMLWVSVEFKMFVVSNCENIKAWKDQTMLSEPEELFSLAPDPIQMLTLKLPTGDEDESKIYVSPNSFSDSFSPVELRQRSESSHQLFSSF